MAKLIANTVVKKDYEYVVLYAGDEVPAWAVDQVGGHLIEAEGATEPESEAPKRSRRS